MKEVKLTKYEQKIEEFISSSKEIKNVSSETKLVFQNTAKNYLKQPKLN